MPRTGESIYERKDGRFEGRYIASRDENGKAKYACVYGKTKQEVRAKLSEAKEKVRREELQGSYTLKQAFEKWLANRSEGLSPGTIDRYEFIMSKYAFPTLGDQEASSITPAQTGALLASLAAKEERGEEAIKGTTLETVRNLLFNVISFAKGDKDIPKELRELYKIEKTPYEPLSRQEVRRIVDCAKYQRCPEMLGVLLALYTGIGTGELCALSWDDVNMSRREIFIHNTIYRIKDKESETKRTKLTIVNVYKSHMRTVNYPEALDRYIREQYREGAYFLTGEKGKLMEQKTFCNRLERILAGFQLKNITLQRVNRTFQEGLADTRYLTDPFFRPEAAKESEGQIDEKWLLKEMEHDLKPLRGILGLSAEDMGQMLDCSSEDYLALEEGEEALDWSEFLSLLFFFRYNSKTEAVVEALGLYPRTLKEKFLIYTQKGTIREGQNPEMAVLGAEDVPGD